MKTILKASLVAATLMSAVTAEAGGPVIIEEGNDELIEAGTVRSGGILPLLGVLVLACLVACGNSGGGGSEPPPVPPKP
jgi:hypothetical protein